MNETINTPKEPTPDVELKLIFDTMQRFRESTIENKLSDRPDLRQYVDSQLGGTLKERFLRSVGFGVCKSCSKPTRYVDKLRFDAYCSTSCDSANRVSGRQSVIDLELKASPHGLRVIGDYPHGIKSEMTVQCSAGHVTTLTLWKLRYGWKFMCMECQRVDKEAADNKMAEIERRVAKSLADERRAARKAETAMKRLELIGTNTDIQCKHCGRFTKYYGDETGVRRRAFCDDTCQSNFYEARRLSKINSKMELLAKTKTWIKPTPATISTAKQLFTFRGCGHTVELRYKLVTKRLDLYNDPGERCPSCTKYSSAYQRNISYLFSVNGIEVVQNTKAILGNRKEIDIYLPKHRVGVEINGIWWHSDVYKDDNYHLVKTELADIQGVKLIQLFTDEYYYNQSLVESKLLAAVGVFSHRVDASECTVMPVPPGLRHEFLGRTHLSGDVEGDVALGLFHGLDLVAVMTMTRQADNVWELSRLAFELGHQVEGGAQALLERFTQDYSPRTITAAVDRRWSRGNTLLTAGFTHVRTTMPDYQYVMTSNQGRGGLDKCIELGMITQDEANGLTQDIRREEMRRKHGMPRIYDCGQLVFERCLT